VEAPRFLAYAILALVVIWASVAFSLAQRPLESRVAVVETDVSYLKQVVEQNRQLLQNLTADVSTIRGVVIGFGGSLTVLQLLQLITQLRRKGGGGER
jgi:hypothetical protein